MFDTALNLWLQARATPALTTAMTLVSLAGSFPGSVAIAAVLAFGWRLRSGLRLLVMLAVVAVLATALKGSLAAPRPDVVDARVQTLGGIQGVRYENSRILAMGDPFGFPSGHAAAAVILTIGGARCFRWRWLLAAGCIWIPLTALSRLYLGRHFPGDVLGGVGLGVAAVLLATPAARVLSAATNRGRTWQPLALLAGALAGLALASDLVRPTDAGRLIGFGIAAWFVTDRDALLAEPSSMRRIARALIALAAAGLPVAWSQRLPAPAGVAQHAGWLAGAVVLNAAIVWGPIVAVRAPRALSKP